MKNNSGNGRVIEHDGGSEGVGGIFCGRFQSSWLIGVRRLRFRSCHRASATAGKRTATVLHLSLDAGSAMFLPSPAVDVSSTSADYTIGAISRQVDDNYGGQKM
jgi:hypothetical protein